MKQTEIIYATSKGIRKMRTEKDLSQKEVAAGSNLDYCVYNRLEAGKAHLQFYHIISLAAYYKISPAELVTFLLQFKPTS